MVEYGPSNAFPAESWVAATTQTNWHFGGGSAVGSVVDGDFKLLGGLTGVSVVDASVMPKLPISGGPLSSVYMLAEFASDRLVDQYASLFGSSKSESDHSSLELFPLVLGGVFIVLGISITVFVLHAVFKKKRDDQHEESIPDSSCNKWEDKLKAMNCNSWVDG